MSGRPVGVRWISALPGGGYGDAGAQYMAALERLGVPVTWTPLHWPPGATGWTPALDYRGALGHLANRVIDHDTVVVHCPPDHGRRFLAEAGGRRTVAFTTWETDRLPEGWDDLLGLFDAVVVPSTFNQNALVATGFDREVHVVPHCARRIGTVEAARLERIGDRFVFYVIATWTTRKAMADTVTAFLDAFTARDEVALVVKTNAYNQQAMARLRRGLDLEGPAGLETAAWTAFADLVGGRRNVPEMTLIAADVPAADIDALHARGDCFFSLTRGEGWGLCIADALLFANPVVVTGWGGHLDYLGQDYPLLVDFDLVATTSDPPDDWSEAREGYRWARARRDHAVDQLRWVADHREEAGRLAASVGARLARQCAPEVIGRRLLDALSGP